MQFLLDDVFHIHVAICNNNCISNIDMIEIETVKVFIKVHVNIVKI